MRFNINKVKPVVGSKRTRLAFLWLPKTIADETRWLEIAMWEEEYMLVEDKKPRAYSFYTGYDVPTIKWISYKWLNR